MIEFKQVSASYALETPILADVSFTIDDGEFVAFVGTNGAGKSTTMRLINGLLKPTSGTVLINSRPTTEMRVSELARNVFLRRYYFFDSVAEIAKRFSFTESKVKNLLFRTRNKLKDYLTKEGISI